MAQIRVFELAKQLGVESKDVLKALQDMGCYLRSASSTIEARLVPRVEEHCLQGSRERRSVSVPVGKGNQVYPRHTPTKSKGSPRKGTPPPITRPGERLPLPSPDLFKNPGGPGRTVEVTEADVLRNLMGSGPLQTGMPPRSRRDRRGWDRSSDRKRPRFTRLQASRKIPIVPDLLDEWELLLFETSGPYADLGELQADAAHWQTLVSSVEFAWKWLRDAPSPADCTTILALAEAGFTPREAFRSFSPLGDGRTTTPYLKVKGGERAADVRALFELAQQRRRAMGG